MFRPRDGPVPFSMVGALGMGNSASEDAATTRDSHQRRGSVPQRVSSHAPRGGAKIIETLWARSCHASHRGADGLPRGESVRSARSEMRERSAGPESAEATPVMIPETHSQSAFKWPSDDTRGTTRRPAAFIRVTAASERPLVSLSRRWIPHHPTVRRGIPATPPTRPAVHGCPVAAKAAKGRATAVIRAPTQVMKETPVSSSR